MANKRHAYRVAVERFGYDRLHRLRPRPHHQRRHQAADRDGSSDPAFRGDPARWNPEDLLIASISACHKLWYLHLCATSGISVLSYRDEAEATMVEDPSGAGRLVSAVSRPNITIRSADDIETAARLHHEAHAHCFIANSVNFPITCEPVVTRGA